VVELPGGAGKLRVIAGASRGVRGPAETFTPMNVLDLRLQGDRACVLEVPEGHTAAIVGLSGRIHIQGNAEALEAGEVGVLQRDGEALGLQAATDATALLLTGEPIAEPIVGQGPFVMNDAAEIRQAMRDYASGKMGRLSPPNGGLSGP